MSDPEQFSAYLATLPFAAFLVVIVAHLGQSFFGALLAARLSPTHPMGVGWVGQSFDLTIEIPDWLGSATRYRIDAHRNTFAESYRRWPNGEFAKEGFDYATAEADLWDYMIDPLDELQVVDGQITLEIRAESVTMLRSRIR